MVLDIFHYGWFTYQYFFVSLDLVVNILGSLLIPESNESLLHTGVIVRRLGLFGEVLEVKHAAVTFY